MTDQILRRPVPPPSPVRSMSPGDSPAEERLGAPRSSRTMSIASSRLGTTASLMTAILHAPAQPLSGSPRASRRPRARTASAAGSAPRRRTRAPPARPRTARADARRTARAVTERRRGTRAETPRGIARSTPTPPLHRARVARPPCRRDRSRGHRRDVARGCVARHPLGRRRERVAIEVAHGQRPVAGAQHLPHVQVAVDPLHRRRIDRVQSREHALCAIGDGPEPLPRRTAGQRHRFIQPGLGAQRHSPILLRDARARGSGRTGLGAARAR